MIYWTYSINLCHRSDKKSGYGGRIVTKVLRSKIVMLCCSRNSVCLMDPTDEFVFTNFWKCGAPSKVCVFSWQMLLDRIQTTDNL
ncbi:hypothetical protein A2U01_0058143, partial [Trifolium medium]|nr:hypothetical protein [Trifolium medium]